MIGRTNATIGDNGSGGNSQQLVNYTMLYDQGNECVEITGGWLPNKSTTYYKSVARNTDSITLVPATAGGYGELMTSNKVDLSKYSKFLIKSSVVIGALSDNANNGEPAYRVCIADERGNYYSGGDSCVTLENTIGTFDKTYVSDINVGVKNIGVQLICKASTHTLTLYNFALFKEDNWQEWIAQADFENYASLEDVISNSDALEILMNNEKAVKYMLLKCTGTVMASVIQSETALKAIRDSKYSVIIWDNEHWNKFLRMVGEVPESEKVYLYNEGDECTDLTGGWLANAVTASNVLAGTATKNKDNLYLYSYQTSSTAIYSNFITANKIDVSQYSKLCCEVENRVFTVDKAYLTMRICDVYSYATQTAAIGLSEDRLELDISNITSQQYVLFIASTGATGYKSSVNIKKVWLE